MHVGLNRALPWLHFAFLHKIWSRRVHCHVLINLQGECIIDHTGSSNSFGHLYGIHLDTQDGLWVLLKRYAFLFQHTVSISGSKDYQGAMNQTLVFYFVIVARVLVLCTSYKMNEKEKIVQIRLCSKRKRPPTVRTWISRGFPCYIFIYYKTYLTHKSNVLMHSCVRYPWVLKSWLCHEEIEKVGAP